VIVLAFLHLPQNDLPLRIHEQQPQTQSSGDLVHQIDLETDFPAL